MSLIVSWKQVRDVRSSDRDPGLVYVLAFFRARFSSKTLALNGTGIIFVLGEYSPRDGSYTSCRECGLDSNSQILSALVTDSPCSHHLVQQRDGGKECI